MDKYEYNIKVEKMKKAVDRKDYSTAAKVADSLVGERSTNAKVLMMIAQVYEKQERYADARNALNEVYNRVPVGKRVVYKLIELALKCDDIEDALDLYQEYQELAPTDPSKLILAYKIAVAKGEPLEKRISILEAYGRREFDEKWAYELATLYQQAGRGPECVAMCDEIILWFGVGPYVDRAMTLKTAYVPLTPEQEERRAHKDYYEKQLEELAAASVAEYADEEPRTDTETPNETDFSDDAEYDESEYDESEYDELEYDEEDIDALEADVDLDEDQSSADFPADAPAVSPVVKEAELHMTMEQELAQSIQSTSEDMIPTPDTNVWITDKPISVDRVGEDIDGQYTLFRTVAEENEEVRRPDHTRTFSFGALLTKTRRLDNLRDLAELNAPETTREAETEAQIEEPATAEDEEAETESTEAPTVDAAPAEEPTVETTPTEEPPAESEVAPEPAVEPVAMAESKPTGEAPAVAAPEAEAEAPTVAAPEAVAEAPAVAAPEAEAEALAEAEPEPAEKPAPEVPAAPQNMIFCHLLELNNDSPVITQIKEAFQEAHKVSGIPAATVARVNTDKINRAGLPAALSKLQGRDLLLEQAGQLSAEVLEELVDAIDEPPCTAVIVLADDADGMMELHRKAPSLFPLSFDWIDELEVLDEDDYPDEDEENEEEFEDSESNPEDEEDAVDPEDENSEEDEDSDEEEEDFDEEDDDSDEEDDDSAEDDEDSDEDEEDSDEDEEDSDEDEEDSDEDEEDSDEEDDDSDEDEGDSDEEDDDFDEEDDDSDEEDEDDEDEEEVDTSRVLTPHQFNAFIHKYALDNDSKFDSMAELALAARLDRMELTGARMTEKVAIDLVEEAMRKAERFSFMSLFTSRYDREGYLIIKESHI